MTPNLPIMGLAGRYHVHRDLRLNAGQGIGLAFRVGQMLRAERDRGREAAAERP